VLIKETSCNWNCDKTANQK